MQTVIIEGYLTANPSVLSAQGSGKKRASFRVLETTRFRKADGTPGERTTGFNCICFNEATAEKYIGPFARKGSRVVIQGHVENDTWTGKDGVEHYDMRVSGRAACSPGPTRRTTWTCLRRRSGGTLRFPLSTAKSSPKPRASSTPPAPHR